MNHPTRRTALGLVAAALAAPAIGGAQESGGFVLRSIRRDTRRIDYLVRRAGNARAPMLLGFGGGDAARGIVDYFAESYLPRSTYADHHVILPIGPPRRLFFQFTDERARAFLDGLAEREPIEGRSIVVGVSNGGRAAFRFAQAAPERFRAIAAMPGAMAAPIVPAGWRDYAVVLANGTEDGRWQRLTDRTYGILQGRVGAVTRLPLAGQGHVVAPGFDIEPVYRRLAELEARLGR